MPDLLGQFLSDLSSIRKKRKVSLETLRDATKVYPNVITQFEKNGLRDHPLFNALYVRAFIRSYAIVLGISPDEVLKAYDRALEGKYNRQLAVEYLDLPAAEIEAIQEVDEDESRVDPVFAVDKFEFKKTTRQVKSVVEPEARVTFVPKPSEPAPQSSLASVTSQAKALIQPVFESGKQNAIIQWGILAGGIGLGIFVIFQLLSFQSDRPETSVNNPPSFQAEPASEESATPVSMPDSTETRPAEITQAPVPVAPLVLGDSIPLYIVAESGKLDPFRLKLDRDMRRPYWLDEGDSMLFYMKDRAVVEDNLDAMKILVGGNQYPIYETDSTAQVIIDRDSLQLNQEVR